MQFYKSFQYIEFFCLLSKVSALSFKSPWNWLKICWSDGFNKNWMLRMDSKDLSQSYFENSNFINNFSWDYKLKRGRQLPEPALLLLFNSLLNFSFFSWFPFTVWMFCFMQIQQYFPADFTLKRFQYLPQPVT